MGAAEQIQVEQGSEEWFKLRLGVITASNAHDLLPSKRGGGFKEARKTYMNTLIAEVCTRQWEEVNARPLEWGRTHESAARQAYQLMTGRKVEPGGFTYAHNKRVGCSKDFKVIGERRGGEIKCPWATRNHIDFLLNGTIKDEWITQVQFSLWVEDFDVWDFSSYDPRMLEKIISIKETVRDFQMSKLFDELVPEFIYEMDKELEKIGIPFGSQWQ